MGYTATILDLSYLDLGYLATILDLSYLGLGYLATMLDLSYLATRQDPRLTSWEWVGNLTA